MKKRSSGRFSWPLRRPAQSGRLLRAKRQRPLHYEPLEERMLLATDVQVRMWFTDTAGNVVDNVQVGQEFILNASVQDLNLSAPTGVAKAYFSLNYNEDYADLVGAEIFHSELYSITSAGTNVLTGGALTSVGGEAASAASLTADGSDLNDPFALFTVHLVAAQVSTLEFTVTETATDVFQLFGAAEPLDFENVQFVGADYGEVISLNVLEAGPAVTSFLRSIPENTSAHFLSKDFTQKFLNLIEGQEGLQYVKITALPTVGTLTFNGAAVTPDQVIPVNNLHLLVYTSPSDVEGMDSDEFSWTGSANGTDYAAAAANVTILVMEADYYINEAPTLSNISKTVPSGSTLTFSTAIFDNAVSDTNLGDAMESVTITSLPAHGTLYYDGAAVTESALDLVIAAADLGKLTYVSTSGYTGTDSFSWKASDGEDEAEFEASVIPTITAAAGNQAPSLTDSSKAATEDTTLSFTAADFTAHFSDNNGDTLQTVKITALPSHGTLYLSGAEVTANQEIDADLLANLTYGPDANYSGTDSFQWNGSDGTDYAAAAATVSLTVSAVNDAPTLASIANPAAIDEDSGLQTIALAGISAGGGESQTLAVTATSSNTALTGNLTITYTSPNATGSLSYTPVANKNGTAMITVTVTDAGLDGVLGTSDDGTFSQQFTVTVNAVNDAPTVTASTQAIDDGATTFHFNSTTFAAHFSDPDGDSLESVRIVSLPTRGTLYLGGTAVAANAVIDVDDLDTLTYVLGSNSTGLDSFTWNGSDGVSYAGASAVMNFAYESDLPTLTDSAKTIATNATLTFTAADFTGHFIDPGVSGLLYTVKITALPAHGTLYLSGTAVTAGQVIAKANLANLTYVSDSSYTGAVTLDWNGSNGKSYAAEDATITITCVADVPTVSNLAINLATDTTLTFTAARFTSCFTDLNPSHSLTAVKITTLPTHGTLKLSGTAVTANQVVAASSLANLTYTPASGYTGADTIQWTGTDGTTYAATAATITITIAAGVPVVSDSSKIVASGSTLTFAATDFTSYFADYNAAHSLTSVKITTLPSHGTLYLSGTAVTANQVIAASSLANLTYSPTTSYTGTDTIQWTASDGTTYAATAATITVTVSSDIPTVSASTQTIASGATLTFDSFDFTDHFSDTNSAHSLQKVKITALPSHGTLVLDYTPVTLNQEISAVDLWKLTYMASSSYTGTDTFAWSGSDGTTYSTASATVTITVKADKPTLTALTKTVATGTTLAFTIRDFAIHFSDPNPAHSLQTVKITALPTKGTLKLLGTAVTVNQEIAYADLANLTYTGNSGVTGSDSFSWNASDGTSYATTASTVTITLASDTPIASTFTKTVAKNTTLTFTASDFTGNFTDYNAAHSLQLVKFTALPSHGTLKFNGVAVTTSQVFGVADLAKLTYTPTADYTGTDTLTWSGSDGTTYSSGATISISTVADVPVVAGFNKNVAVTTSSTSPVLLNFLATDFTSNFIDYDASDSLQKIKITQLPTHGTLKLNGTAVTLNQEIAVNDLSKLTYQTNVNFVGTDTIKWNGSDGDNYAATAATITLNSVANVPTVSDFTKTVLAGTSTITFTVSDFADRFTDPAGSALKIVKITQLPIRGTLYLNSVAVTVGQEINAADLAGLTYVPASSSSTAYSDAFKWIGMGSPYSANESTTTITAESDVPTLTSFTKTILAGATYTFTSADFSTNFSDDDSLQKVKITELPSNGTLKLNSVAVTLNQEIALADLANLTYTSTTSSAATDTIGWNASDGTNYAASNATITFNAVSDVPSVSNFSKTVAEDTSLSFTASDFTSHFTDLDSSHSLQTVKITALPSHGTLSLSGTAVTVNQVITAANLANLTYLGASNYNGTDSFTWVASDGTTYATTAATVALTVSAVNDLPTVSNSTKTTALNTQLTFAATDFSNYFSDVDSDTLQKIKITALPTHGTLKLSGTAVTVNQEIALASLANLTYDPTSSYSGTDTFTWTGSDGTGYATTGATLTITVSGSGSGAASLAGSVYVDANNNGVRDASELGLPNVGIQLLKQGADQTWSVVSSAMTDSSGNYSFTGLAAGTYKVLEIAQPSSYSDGVETAGSAGGTAGSDVISGIELDAGEAATGYLFGERGIAARLLSLRLFLLNSGPVTQYLASLNKAPTVDLNGSSSGTGSSATFTTGDSAVSIASGATITDTDGGCLNSMTVSITNLGDGDSEVLAATTTGTGISSTYSGGVLRLTGAASLATYQTVLRSITYQNSDTTPTTGDRAITVVVSDGVASSAIATATVTVKSTSSSTTPTASVTTAPPTITASSGSTSTTTVTVTYADTDNGIDTTSFGTADISVTNGATVTSYSASGNAVTYTITAPSSTWSASTQGTYTISLVANQVKDLAGNYVAANSSLATFKVDTVVPTATVTTAPATITSSSSSGSTTTLVVTYADSGLGMDTSSFGIADIAVNNGATVTSYSASGNVVTYTITAPSTTWGASTQGTYTVSLVANQVKDLAGNYVAANSSLTTFKVDTVAPTVTINQKSTQSDPTTGSTIYYTVVFSESVSDFATGDVTFSGTATGTLVGTVTGSGTTYEVAVTGMTGSGTVIASIAAGAAHDAAGNANTASTSTDNSVNYNQTPLTVTINQASTQVDPTLASTIHFTVVFSQSVSNFATGDVTLGGTAPGTLIGTVTGSGTTYDVAVTGMTGSGTVIASIAAGVATDGSGNANSASTSTDNVVTYDVTGPTVAINKASTQSDPTNVTTIYFTVVFSEAVSDFTTGDVTLVSSAGDTLIGVVTPVGSDGTTYTVAVSGMTTTNSTVTATIDAGKAHDAAGNANAGSTSTDNVVAFDITAPTVTVTRAGSQDEVTSQSPIHFLVDFSEVVTGFTADDITLGGTAPGTLVATVTPDGTDNTKYDVSVSGMTGSGTVIVSVGAAVAADAAGNLNIAAPSSATVTYDVTGPTVTIARADGQDEVTNNSTIHFTVVFSEAVSDFATGDVTFTGSTAGGSLVGTVTGSGTTYDVAVTGMTSSGTVIASILAGVAEDAAGNDSLASNTVTVTYDNVAPTASVTTAAPTINAANGATFTTTIIVTYADSDSEIDASSFGTSNLTVDKGATVTSHSVNGNAVTYTITAPAASWSDSPQGAYTISLIANQVKDLAGNYVAANSSLATFNVDTVAPTVTINQADIQDDPTNQSPIVFTVVFSEPVTGFTHSDVTVVSSAGDTLVAAVTDSGDHMTYIVNVSGMTTSDSTVTATIAAGVATDAAGNANTASTSTDNQVTYDVTAPTVTINQASAQADPTGDSPIVFTVVFSEAVTGFTDGDVTVVSSAGDTLVAAVTDSGDHMTYTVSVSGMTTSDSTVTATIAAGVATDAAGNANTASTSTDNQVTYDVTAPTVTINQASAQADPTGDSPIVFTVVFSEAVTGFTDGDVTVVSSAGDTLVAAVTDSGDHMTYIVNVTGMTTSDSTVTATIAAGVATDAAGNANTASTSTDNQVTYQAGEPLTMPSSASVVQNGTEVVVTGTSGADTIVFIATASQYTLTVNDTTYTYSTSEVYSFVINGNGGDDTVELTGDDSNQTAVLHPTSATFQGASFAVEVTNAKSIKITAGSGDSEAQLYDSVGNDLLQAEGLLASLTGDDFAEMVVGFKRVTASATSGGTDTASVSATDFLLSQQGSWL